MSNYHKHLEEYYQVYRKSIREPEEIFWEEIAEKSILFGRKKNGIKC
jgi:acetyl-CoA synthetase